MTIAAVSSRRDTRIDVPRECQVREALERDRLRLFAQPIVDLRSRRVAWHEILLRIAADDGTMRPPAAFLSQAERSGLVRQIDAWVAGEGISVIAGQARRGHELRLAVNISGHSLGDPELVPTICRKVSRSGIDPASLLFEITETAAISNFGQAKRFVRRLKAEGCLFALDDFGVGFSSFLYLKHLPIDFLKIDGDFVRRLRGDTVDAQLVAAIVGIARGLGIKTVAEFVSSERCVRSLSALGVDYGQGYFLGRPRPLSEVILTPDGTSAPELEF